MNSFTNTQQRFLDYVRAAEPGEPPQGTDARHMAVYRELLFNNLSNFVSSGLPVLKSFHSEDRWQERLRHFFQCHDCHSPLFVEIAGEFVRYLEQQSQHDFPWEVDLAQYEYLELWVDVQDEVLDQPRLDAEGITGDTRLACYRAAALGTYDYPVHLLGQQQPTVDPEPTFLLVYRDAEEEVAFSQMNPLTAQLLIELWDQPGLTLSALTERLHTQLPQLPAAVVVDGVDTMVRQLAQRGVIRLDQN